MKFLRTIDNRILSLWQVSADERLWAYLGLFPLFAMISYLAALPFLP